MLIKAIFSLVLISVSFFSHAGLIIADFRTESDIPELRSQGAKTYQSLAQVIGVGPELDSDDLVANPSSWEGFVLMDFDPLNGVLTLNSQDTWDFQIFDAWMNNISFSQPGEFIIGFSLLSNNMVTNGIEPVLSYTANSLHISYSTASIFEFTGGQATFLVKTSLQPAAVPEPASLAIFGLALLGLGAGRRMSRR